MSEERRQKNEERQRRHELWISFVGRFFAMRGEAEPPITYKEWQKKKAIEKGKAKPDEPTVQEWRQQAENRKAWEELRKAYFEAAAAPYHFEEIMGFSGHYFPEPEKRERRVLSAQEIREQERMAQSDFIAALAEQVSRSSLANRDS